MSPGRHFSVFVCCLFGANNSNSGFGCSFDLGEGLNCLRLWKTASNSELPALGQALDENSWLWPLGKRRSLNLSFQEGFCLSFQTTSHLALWHEQHDRPLLESWNSFRMLIYTWHKAQEKPCQLGYIWNLQPRLPGCTAWWLLLAILSFAATSIPFCKQLSFGSGMTQNLNQTPGLFGLVASFKITLSSFRMSSSWDWWRR